MDQIMYLNDTCECINIKDKKMIYKIFRQLFKISMKVLIFIKTPFVTWEIPAIPARKDQH
jgi:hypothetical protein